MNNNSLLILTLIAGLGVFLAYNVALAQEDYVLDEVLIISGGSLTSLAASSEIQRFVKLQPETGPVTTIEIGDPIPAGATIVVEDGANIKLESRRRLLWLNYGSVIRQESDHIKVVKGEVYGKGKRFRLFGNKLKLIDTSTEFYIKVNEDTGTELLYVFNGNVTVADGNTQRTVSKKKAVRISAANVLENVKLDDILLKPDIERIKKWRYNINWMALPWYSRLIQLPKRYPKITAGILALVGGKVIYEIGQGEADG